MKKRRSKAYLIVSSGQLGVDNEILSVFKKVIDYYNAEVFHLGPTATEKEVKDYASLTKKINKIDRDFASREMTDRQEETLTEQFDKLNSELEFLTNVHESRLLKLRSAFNKLTFVTNDQVSLPMSSKFKVIHHGTNLGKYLFLSAVPPRGIRATRNPINKQSLSYLKKYGRNWIVGFPVPSVEPLPKPGLNESYNYWTTGCLQDVREPHKHNEMYQTDHLPCAVFVVIDQENDEFHARHMHIDYTKTGQKFIADDGLVFFKDKVIETKSSDRMTASTDDHAPHQHPGVLGCVRALNKLMQPETFLNNGDASDFESINRHAQDRPGYTEGLRLVNDLQSLRNLFNAQAEEKSIKRKVLIDSNHHEWVTDLVNKLPALKGLIDWPTLAKTWYSDWEIIIRTAGDNQVFYFGDYMIRHGDKDGGPKKAETKTPSGKYFCGHFHRYVGYKRCYSGGCGAKLGPGYTQNDINAWQSQIFSFTKHQDIASISPKTVLHDKVKPVSRFAYRGTIFEVPHHII